MGEELDEFSDALPYDDDPLPPNSSDITSDITSDAICDARVVPLSSGAPLNFANLALHDNLTTEAKAASESQKERLREFDSNNTVEGLTLGEVDRLPVSASSPPPPPTAPTVESPPPAAPTTPAPNALDDSSSTYTSPNSDAKFKMVNQDTGEVIDLRDLDSGKVEQPKFSLMPSKEEFLRRGSGASVDSDEESHATSGSKNTKGVAGKAKVSKSCIRLPAYRFRVVRMHYTHPWLHRPTPTHTAAHRLAQGFFKSMTGKSKAGGKPTSEPHKGAHSIPVQPSKVKGKDVQEFSDFVHVTHIPPSATQGHSGSVWCMEFSPDGKYLATGGADKIINVWEVARVPGSGKEGKEKKNKPPTNMGSDEKRGKGKAWKAAPPSAGERGGGGESSHDSRCLRDTPPRPFVHTCFAGTQLCAPFVHTCPWPPADIGNVELFSGPPIRRFAEHKLDVISLSWSRTSFLLSGSMDKTVRLWHVSREECLHLFQHSDFVTAVCFHPLEDRYFLSGGFDKKLRIWSIPEGRVKEWSQAPEMVTSAAFSPTGMWVVAGLFHGQVYFYSTNDGLRYYTQIDAKNRHGTQKGGKKVTGLSFLRGLGAARSDTVGSIDSLRLSNSSRSSSRDSRDSRDSSTSR